MTPFARSRPFTLGIEEELLIVDPVTLALEPAAGEILARVEAPPAAVGGEAYAAQVELRSWPATTVAGAVDSIRSARAAALEAGAALMGVGVHPTGAWGDAPLLDDDRYRAVDCAVRGLIRRTPESALHVHVGMADPEAAVRAYNGLRPYLPVLQALSANSPWWFGADSGLASARYALVRSYPGRGVPPPLADFDDWETHMRQVTRAAGVDDYTFVWSDLRLHPRHGTVEVREMDAQAPIERVAALAALVRALAREAVDDPPGAHVPSEAVAWASFRAARDGLDASIDWNGAQRSLRGLVRATVHRLRPVAADLGDEDALLAILDIVEEGGGAERQRRAYAAGGVEGMLRSLERDTRRGALRDPAPPRRTDDDRAARIAREWLDARSRGDLIRVAELTAEDAAWHSPVDGVRRGREAVLEEIGAAFTETDAFATELLSLEMRGTRGAAVIRNSGRRGPDTLDSLQTLFLTVERSKVRSVRVAVDDPEAVASFWSD